jgi:hypothetical protein
MTAFTESEIEVLSLDELGLLGFGWVTGATIAPEAVGQLWPRCWT